MTTRAPEEGDERRDGPPASEPGAGSGRSRMEREVEEILERTSREPVSIAAERRRRGSAAGGPVRHRSVTRPPGPPSVGAGDLLRRFERLGRGRYLVVAVVAAVLALVVSDVSPLLATLLAVVCVAAIFIPVVQQFRTPESGPNTMWRGRDITGGPGRPDPLGRLGDRFRRPPRI
jgi:hypothetical protein